MENSKVKLRIGKTVSPTFHELIQSKELLLRERRIDRRENTL